jgi:hypothetical protein
VHNCAHQIVKSNNTAWWQIAHLTVLNQYYPKKVHMKYYKKQKKFLKLSPVAASLLLLPVMAQAEISIIGGDITSASNGVPIVNIKEANGSGLSHNVYETLNVGKEGVIFNNASSTAQTVLAGQIAANANLAGERQKLFSMK